ncbi:MAG TPA: sugar phosphate isomerase/epimerase [Dehalococcoidia bacterium]
MTVIALSTMWAQQERFRGQRILGFAAFARDHGFTHIEVNYAIPPQEVETLVRGGILPISSLHAPAPLVKHRDGRWNHTLNLASRDEEERRAMVAYTKRTIDVTAEAGGSAVVVHLGHIGDGAMFEEERELRRLHECRQADDPRCAELRARAAERRRREAPRYFPQAERSLAELAEHAARRGVTIGLESRFHFHEFPNVEECLTLIAGYPPEVVGFWLDTGHVEVLDRLGFIPKGRWLDVLGDRLVGMHLHDVDGITDHRAVGLGDIRWDGLRQGVVTRPLYVFEINQRQPDWAVARSVTLLQDLGVVPRPEAARGTEERGPGAAGAP